MTIHMTECEKLATVADDSQKIGAFLDWLGDEQGIHLCKSHEHTDSCYAWGTVEPPVDGTRSWDSVNYRQRYTDEKWLDCGYHDGESILIHESFEKLLARYFNIDLGKVEKEKRALLEELREANNGTKR